MQAQRHTVKMYDSACCDTKHKLLHKKVYVNAKRVHFYQGSILFCVIKFWSQLYCITINGELQANKKKICFYPKLLWFRFSVLSVKAGRRKRRKERKAKYPPNKPPLCKGGNERGDC